MIRDHHHLIIFLLFAMLLFSGLTYFPIRQTAAQLQPQVPSSPSPPSLSQPQSQLGQSQQEGPRFLVTVDKITVDGALPRPNLFFVALAGKVGQAGQPWSTSTFMPAWGQQVTNDIKTVLVSFDVPEGQTLSFSYIVGNNTTAKRAENGAVYLLGPTSPSVLSGAVYLQQIIRLFAAKLLPGDCIGNIAADKIILSNSQLQQMTSRGPHTETRFYPGTSSALFHCGIYNLKYHVTWTVKRTE